MSYYAKVNGIIIINPSFIRNPILKSDAECVAFLKGLWYAAGLSGLDEFTYSKVEAINYYNIVIDIDHIYCDYDEEKWLKYTEYLDGILAEYEIKCVGEDDNRWELMSLYGDHKTDLKEALESFERKTVAGIYVIYRVDYSVLCNRFGCTTLYGIYTTYDDAKMDFDSMKKYDCNKYILAYQEYGSDKQPVFLAEVNGKEEIK